MSRRRSNPQLVKIHRNYSVAEIARLFGIHKNTVRNWLKQGLKVVDNRRPLLVLGAELRRFLHDRRNKRKQSCGPGQIYCVACRAPKVPAGTWAECTRITPFAGTLCGMCPDCERLIYRRVNLAKIDEVRGELEISFMKAQPRIRERGTLSVDCEFNKEAVTHESV